MSYIKKIDIRNFFVYDINMEKLPSERKIGWYSSADGEKVVGVVFIQPDVIADLSANKCRNRPSSRLIKRQLGIGKDKVEKWSLSLILLLILLWGRRWS